MNSTGIFCNNGQLNWDVINTISNIFLISALVLITGYYANEVRKQTRLMIKNRERTKVLEEVQDVLTPAINHIDFEINVIQNKKIKNLYSIIRTSYPNGCPAIYSSVERSRL